MNPDEDRRRAKSDELQLIAAREIASLIGLAAVLIMLHPAVNVWVRHQAWRLRQAATSRKRREDAAVAEFRRAWSRWEHEQMRAES